MDQPSDARAMQGDARAVFSYDGRLSELFGIFLVNLLLTIITLGIFRFWAITRTRRYLWSHLRFEETRLVYTGSGHELLLGFLRATLVLMLLLYGAAVASGVLQKSGPTLARLPFVIAAAGLVVWFGAARFSSQRYRLSRTEWRGIRGGMDGSPLRYGANCLISVLACFLTAFQAVPWVQVGLARWRIDACRFGSAEFRCDGHGGRLYFPWLAAVLGHILLLGLIVAAVARFDGISVAHLFSGKLKGMGMHIVATHAIAGGLTYIVGSSLLATGYYASFLRVVLGHTSALVRGSFRNETLRFGTTVEARKLYWLFVGNLLIVVLTLGLGMPFVLHRQAGFLARTIFMTGTFDANTLTQSTLARPTLGEGFLQTLDPGIV